MPDNSLEQYRNRVSDVGQSLLDVIASVALGDFDVDVDVPNDIEELADLAVGLQFMIEDLKNLNQRLKGSRKDDTGIFSGRIKPKIIEMLEKWFPLKKQLQKAITINGGDKNSKP